MTIKAVIELPNLSELVRKPFITFLKIKKIHWDASCSGYNLYRYR